MIIEVIGWAGSIMVVTAYALIVKGGKNILFFCNYLNLLGAALVAVNCYYNTSFPSLFLNVTWIVIAFTGIIQQKKTTK